MADYAYVPIDRLIPVRVVVHGKDRTFRGDFILDTGASMTLIATERVDWMGYSARNAVGFSSVSSPVGKEHGYRVRVHCFEALGKTLPDFEVACHDLGIKHIDGLLGMNFLEHFRIGIDARRHIISIE